MDFEPTLRPACPDTHDGGACSPESRKPYNAPALSDLGSFGTRTLGQGGSIPDSNFGKQQAGGGG